MIYKLVEFGSNNIFCINYTKVANQYGPVYVIMIYIVLNSLFHHGKTLLLNINQLTGLKTYHFCLICPRANVQVAVTATDQVDNA